MPKRVQKQASWRRYLQWGPFQSEILALLLVAVGVITLLELLGVTHGILSAGWLRVLRQLFGLGTYPVAVMVITAGLVMLQWRFGKQWDIPWDKVIGFEAFFLALLGLLHLGVPGEDPLSLAQAGSGGGYLGWAISHSLAQLFGYEVCAVLLAAVALWGLIVVSPWTAADLWAHVRRRASTVRLRWPLRLPRLTIQVGQGVETGAAPHRTRRKAAKRGETQPEQEEVTLAPPQAESPGSLTSSKEIAKARKQGKLPSLDILDKYSPRAYEESEVKRKAQIIEETLASFGVPVTVVDINRGPTVTQFGVEPGYVERRGRNGEPAYSRVRVNKISALVNDLALALAAAPLRIEAPVPGRSVVGIEVPNAEIAVVSLRSIMESSAFTKMKSRLKIALGQDVAGQPVVADLATLPHLLIAGATGSGKSVCINAIITGLLFNNTPEQLRLLLIDPKMVELTGYNGVPHLLSPVVTEIDQVVGALTWITRTMEERYRLFSKNRVRNIEDYNKMSQRADTEELPYIVVVIDELADLMMAAPTEVEWAICRIAQMARATGIHLVIATQRPSVDVVTGLIKANFPARISFAVTSQVDSRVIIDGSGAEALLGRGDMLYIAPDAARAVRVQGCYVSDDEISRLVAFWRKSSRQEDAAHEHDEEDYPWRDIVTREERDELFDEAAELVRVNGRASASFLQRRLRIGYPRAARLMDQLEEAGVIEKVEGIHRSRQVSDAEPDEWADEQGYDSDMSDPAESDR